MEHSSSLDFDCNREENWEYFRDCQRCYDCRCGGKDQRHINVLVDLDVTKALLRGTKLRHKQSECWVEFKYENLPLFCFYCGCLGHNEKGCAQRKLDVAQNMVLQDQFGY